jgi:tetratricopeptide (TPR) repeat protein
LIKWIYAISSGISAICLLGIMYGSPHPDSAAQAFYEANTQYQQGNYAAAQGYYLQALRAGIESGPLYYNLGNACFKLKRLGEAIYYWERAKQKLPGDADVLENLELSNLMIVDRIEVPPEPFPLRVLNRTIGFFTINQMSWFALILHLAGNCFLTFYLLVPAARFARRALAAGITIELLVILVAGVVAMKAYETRSNKEGVVVEQKVDVRSGPGAENITVFTIHEGIRVRVRSRVNDWYQVVLPNGWNGWLQQDSIRVL